MKAFKYLFVLVALATTGCVQGTTVNLNQLIDEVLASANQIVTMSGKAQLPVSGCSSNWHTRWHFIKVSGSLSCSNGRVGQLNTLKRIGDASMTTNSNTVTIKAQLGLGDLDFHFDTCRAKVHHILSVSSHVDGKIDSESISFQLSLSYNQNKQCSAKLDRISLDSIGKINLKTGGGVFHKVEDKLLDAIANHFRGKAKDEINSKLTPLAQQAVAKNAAKLCQNIPH